MAATRPGARSRLRWRLVDEPGATGPDPGHVGDHPTGRGPCQGTLFPDEAVARIPGTGEFAGTDFLHVRAGRVINEVSGGARFGFRFTLNAYRGCMHACSYCFARPTHEWLGLDGGDDFDRVIVVKVDAPERLAAELRHPRWAGDLVAMGTNTDPYQRAEGRYRLTRRLLEVLVEARNPCSVLTKSPLVLRDLDVLRRAASLGVQARVAFSVGTLDEEVWRLTEPGAPHPRLRLDAAARLAAAGIPTGVLCAPLIPGLSDGAEQIDALVAACAERGLRPTPGGVLRLRPGVREVYLDRLARARPALAEATARRYRRTEAPEPVRRRIARCFDAAMARHGLSPAPADDG